ISQQVYGTRRVDDRIVDIRSVKLRPRAGSYIEDGKRVTRTREQVGQTIERARQAWARKHPDAASGGPWPWRSFVTVKRDGAAMPQTLKVTFADGSSKTVRWDDGSRWKRFRWDAPTRVVSAVLDPEHEDFLDADVLDNSYTVAANPAASRRWTADFAALAK